VWLGLRRDAFTFVGWQVTLCDPIRQVTIRSSVWVSYKELQPPLTFVDAGCCRLRFLFNLAGYFLKSLHVI